MQNHTDISTAAAALGSKGGKSTSKAKTNASRSNGAKGGRPGMYAVESLAKGYEDFGPEEYHGHGLSKTAAIALAKSLVSDGWSRVYITWSRASDGQRGYLNPSGDHSITGSSWD